MDPVLAVDSLAVAGTGHRALRAASRRSLRPAAGFRTLELPQQAAESLRDHHKRQAAQRLKAGKAWQDRNLVFCSPAGASLDAANVRRAFRLITKKAGIGETWTPRELRHSFVSIMSDNGVPIENIADLCGHSSTAVTEEVYRHQLKPVITKGAEAMNTIFKKNKSA
jgi:site-specific recombinase XerD